MVNPAATGVYDYIGINAGGRKQWTGIPNAPNTSYIYFSAPVDNLRKGKMKLTYGILKNRNRSVKHPTMRIGKFAQAFGGYALADQYGAYRQYKMMGTYAVHIPLGRQVSLSFGTSVGLSNRTFLAGNAEVFSVLNNTGQNDALYNWPLFYSVFYNHKLRHAPRDTQGYTSV